MNLSILGVEVMEEILEKFIPKMETEQPPIHRSSCTLIINPPTSYSWQYRDWDLKAPEQLFWQSEKSWHHCGY